MMSDKELKPCPFCGGKAILEESIFGLNAIHCESCDGMMTALHIDDLIKAWNTRVDNVAKTDECYKKSCKAESATLKPCPFCNGKAHVSRCADDCRYSAIYCESCGLVAKWYHDYEDEAINHWNKRTTESYNSANHKLKHLKK